MAAATATATRKPRRSAAKKAAATRAMQGPAFDDLQSEEMLRLAGQIENWWDEARDRHAESRAQRLLDHDYYDHDQLSPEDRAVYEERNQAPVVLNLIHGAIDWVTGTERRTRVDWVLHPRGPEDEQGAKAQTQVLKYVSDANRAPWERSRAFKDAVISGVGFIEEFLRKDKSKEAIGYGYEDWRHIWWDPYSRALDFSDARYVHRAKFVDLDRAIAMFPKYAAVLRSIAVNSLDDEYELLDEVDGMPALFALSGNAYEGRTSLGRKSGLIDQYSRLRVRLIETWHYREQVSKEIKAEVFEYADLQGQTYDATNPAHAEALKEGHISLNDSLTLKMHLAVWSPGAGLLSYRASPYSHNLYPFTPFWGFRHHRTGMPYGLVRGMRDAQDEFNKRRAKALFAASANQVWYEEDAFDDDDERDNLDEINKPNGEIRLSSGALRDGKVKVDRMLDVANAHVDLQAQAKEHIYEGNGITRENLGQNTNAISGRAILAKQQQGAVTTAEIFDLMRYAIEVSGQKLTELCRTGMSTPRKIRIAGQNDGWEWLAINEPKFDPLTNEVTWENDMLNTLCDFKVSDQDYRETVRLAMAESLFEVIGKMDPAVGMQLLDLVIDMTDIPNKAEFVARIQKINGVQPTPPSPEEAAAQQAQQDAQAQAQQVEVEAAAARADKDRASAEKLRADAASQRLADKPVALDVAGLAAAAAPLTTTADMLLAGASRTPPEPVQAGVIR